MRKNPIGVLPRMAGVPDLQKLERELREWMERVERKIDAIIDARKPMDDRGS